MSFLKKTPARHAIQEKQEKLPLNPKYEKLPPKVPANEKKDSLISLG
jgi:hypothetical protein